MEDKIESFCTQFDIKDSDAIYYVQQSAKANAIPVKCR